MIVPFGSCDAIDAHRVPGLARQVLARQHLPGAGIVVEGLRRRLIYLQQLPRARVNTARIIGGVSLPVLVFWRLGW